MAEMWQGLILELMNLELLMFSFLALLLCFLIFKLLLPTLTRHWTVSSSTEDVFQSMLRDLSPTISEVEFSKKTKTNQTNQSKQIVSYDESFARRQVSLYFGACSVCQKQRYFLKTCDRCHSNKYCSRKCLSFHRKRKDQKSKCAHYASFHEVRANIPQGLMHTIFENGFKEISPYLCSVPRKDIYIMIGGPRAVVLLFAFEYKIEAGIFMVKVQDIQGFCSWMQFYPPPFIAGAILYSLWLTTMKILVPLDSYVLLLDGYWNFHQDKTCAAIPIQDIMKICVL